MTLTSDKIKPQRFLIWVLLFALLTVLTHFAFANYTALSNRAFEQIAWQYLIDDCVESGLTVEAIIPSNTDSGMLVLSLLAILLQSLFHSVSGVALASGICTAFSITFQVAIADRVFGRTTALLFLCWNILATPILWPLNAAYFGSQTFTSLFPFLIVVLFSPSRFLKPAIAPALIVAAFVCFSLQNAALIPAYILTTLLSKYHDKKNHAIIFSLISISGVIVYYTLLSKILHQSAPAPLQLLGISTSLVTDYSSILANFVLIFTEVLPKGIFLYSSDTFFNYAAYWLLLATLLIGLAYYVKEASKLSIQVLAATVTVVVFILISACNSSTTVDTAKFNFFSLRSFSYILPLFFAALFFALCNSYKLGKKLSYILLVLCGYYSLKYVSDFEPISAQSHKPAAWLLAKSMSTKPEVLLRISNRADISKKNELISGYAWGLTATVLKDTRPGDSQKLESLKNTLSSFGEGNKSALLEGLNTAFAKGVTPALDQNYLAPLQEHLTRHP